MWESVSLNERKRRHGLGCLSDSKGKSRHSTNNLMMFMFPTPNCTEMKPDLDPKLVYGKTFEPDLLETQMKQNQKVLDWCVDT